jgi:hypothetical protein
LDARAGYRVPAVLPQFRAWPGQLSPDRTLTFVAGYGRAEWASHGSGDGSGIGGRVGFHHKTLGGFLGAFTGAGLNIRACASSSAAASCSPATWPSWPKRLNRSGHPADSGRKAPAEHDQCTKGPAITGLLVHS